MFVLVFFSVLLGAASSVMLLMDDSGSMGGSLPDGTEKLEAAKTAANNLLSNISPGDEVALMVFYDCDDIRVEEDFTHDFTYMRSIINGLQPDSSTPLAAAIEEASDYMVSHASYNKKVLIVLTDGEETCGGDPVAASQRAKSMGIDVIHVIGYDVEPGSSTEEQLKNIASAGGGKYYSAEDAGQLNQALQQAYKESTEEVCCCGPALILLAGLGFVFVRF